MLVFTITDNVSNVNLRPKHADGPLAGFGSVVQSMNVDTDQLDLHIMVFTVQSVHTRTICDDITNQDAIRYQ